MANVAKLKAKLVMETEEYMKSAEKVVGRTKTMATQVDKITKKIAKSYANAITDSVMSVFSADAIDGAMRGLAKALDSFDPQNMRNFGATMSGIADTIGDIVKQIPLIGAAAQLGQSAYYSIARMFGGSEFDPQKEQAALKAIEDRKKFTESQKPALELLKSLEYQTELAHAATEEERKRVQLEHEREEMMKKLNGMAEGPQKENMRKQLESAIKQMQVERALAEQRKRAEDEAAKAAKEKQAQEEKLNKSREDFMRKMEEDLKASTLTDRQKFEERMDELKIEGDARKRMYEIYDQLHKASPATDPSGAGRAQTAGVSSAIGSIRMAGAVDYSQQRMATSLDSIKQSSQKTTDLTQKLLESQRTC